MTIKIILNDHGNPPGKLADAELHFSGTIECPACEGHGQTCRTLADGDNETIPCCRCEGTGRRPNPLAGLKLIGFGMGERRGGNGRNVTFPARQYSINGERRSFALLRPVVDPQAQESIRQMILEAYALQVEGIDGR